MSPNKQLPVRASGPTVFSQWDTRLTPPHTHSFGRHLIPSRHVLEMPNPPHAVLGRAPHVVLNRDRGKMWWSTSMTRTSWCGSFRKRLESRVPSSIRLRKVVFRFAFPDSHEAETMRLEKGASCPDPKNTSLGSRPAIATDYSGLSWGPQGSVSNLDIARRPCR